MDMDQELKMQKMMTDMNRNWGSLFIETIAASVFYGMMLLQAFTFFFRYPKGHFRDKGIVILLCVVNTAALALAWHGLYTFLITGHGRQGPMQLIRSVNWSILINPAITSLMGLFAHLCLGYRVWKICNKNVFMAFVIIFASAACFALTVVGVGIRFSMHETFGFERMRWIVLAIGITTIPLEGGIVTVQCIWTRNTVGSTKTPLARTMMYVFNTGLLALLLSITTIVTYFAMPGTLVFLGINLILAKVYAIAVLANMKSRGFNPEHRQIEIGVNVTRAFARSSTPAFHSTRQDSEMMLQNMTPVRPSRMHKTSDGSLETKDLDFKHGRAVAL
ncbi:hypothetical protein P691DRAFT_212756 [Macrolepiota fuliginosa MF-IS2]|uniref:DUF6534 domain-containing protein n=1 Tax=Macrolepiota fuliginosa MF-IS2 TaxID=1400762 RepID=A0A9P5X917_9AGAR|nr:hypothetical protein P691DRAFT_212756 [Macrolepiota fuliginosa MF-IS2]